MIISLAQEWDRALGECVNAIKAGRLIVYPTDTVYGLGGNALDKGVVEKALKAKNRDKSAPFSVMIPNLEMLLKYFEVTDAERDLMVNSLPGPFTFVLKAKIPMPVQGENGTVGVRIPNHSFMRRVCFEANVPIITTSANLHGQPAPTKFQDVPKQIIDAAEVAIDGGETMLKGPSTVVNLKEKKIERKGVADFQF
jgi:L-threonylcarbamoyladenylate synthase